MNATVLTPDDASLFATLNGIPQVDFPRNLQAAVTAGRRMSSILREVVRLRLGTGKLTPNEYFYYRLWEPQLTRQDKGSYVGKQAQQPMHVACNHTGWYAAAADKLLFHTLMTGAGLPTPETLAITQADRRVPGGRVLAGERDIEAFLREASHYPLFAKPADGKYSISVVSADGYDADTDQVVLRGAGPASPAALAKTLASREAGYLLQRRLTPQAELAKRFGPCLWSVRVIVLMTAAGPVIHRAVVKIATGQNPADNFWRPGNMLGAIDLATGQIGRVVQGTGAEMIVNASHPDTGRPLVGTPIPEWGRLTTLVEEAARLLPAIRTQAWDIALTDAGPMPLEVNFGGDLNLAQLAFGEGMLDERYQEHLRACGYRLR